jgi:ketosteroid isomerase-like protein
MSPVPFLACIALFVAAPAQAADDQALAAELQAKSQALVDAIAPGNSAPWRSMTDPNLLFVTENNTVLGKEDLLKELTPLPKGLVGNIKVTDYQLQRHGNTAIATYISDETLDYHGQILKTKFRTTESWFQSNGEWRMISSMTLAVLNDPPAISLPSAMLDEYVGRYELTPEIHYTIRRDAGRLFGLREGGKEVELNAEAPDLFFVGGSPRSRKVFYRDPIGKVVGFGDRREGQDIKWKRLP